MAHLSKLEREASLRDPWNYKGSLSVLVTTWPAGDRLHPWKLLPMQRTPRGKGRGCRQCLHTWAGTHRCVTPESSARCCVWDRTDGAGCSSPVPISASGLRSFPCSKHPRAPWPFKTPQGGQHVLRKTRRRAEERVRSQWAEQPFANRFKLLGATNPLAGDGSAGVLCSQLCQPVFRTGLIYLL